MTSATIESGNERPGTMAPMMNLWPRGPLTLDQTTLEDAYGTHRGSAYQLAYGILGDRHAAEDAVQDAFLKLWTGTAQYDPARGSMRGLLMTIARHTSIDVIRKRARRQKTETAYCHDATYVTDGPERATERADDERRVRSAVAALPADQRSAIEMAYFAGLTRREIAASHTVPTGTVKSRLRLGMKKLSVALADPLPK
jgi:RNA polymerase sigma-70 factor (ECF subfamily)